MIKEIILTKKADEHLTKLEQDQSKAKILKMEKRFLNHTLNKILQVHIASFGTMDPTQIKSLLSLSCLIQIKIYTAEEIYA